MSEQLCDVDVAALVEQFLSGAVVMEEEPQTVSINVPATRAEMALVRYLRRLQAARGPLELPPGAYLKAMMAGWQSPQAAQAIQKAAEDQMAEARALVAEADVRLNQVYALERRIAEQDAKIKNALHHLIRARDSVGMCGPGRNRITMGIQILESEI